MPVYDQYEVEPVSTYSGSFTYEVVLGNSLTVLPITGSRFTINNSQRQVAGDRLRGVYNSYFVSVPKWQFSVYSDIKNKKQISGAVTLVSFASNEIVYDSVMPDMVEIALANQDYLLTTLNAGNITSDIDLNAPAFPPSETVSIVIRKQSKWLKAFPFESKYKRLKRFQSTGRKISINSGSLKYVGEVTFEDPNGDLYTILDISSSNVSVEFDGGAPPFEDEYNRNQMLLIPIPIVRNFFFSFGNGFPTRGGTVSEKARYTSMPEFRYKIYPDPYFLAEPIYRGFRYGVFNPNIRYQSITYRRGHFGQYRDMLEGRLTTATLVESEINPYNSRPIPRTIFYPIEIAYTRDTLIYSQSRDYLTATNPDYNPYDSGIYDKYYRSGQPFFDRENED